MTWLYIPPSMSLPSAPAPEDSPSGSSSSWNDYAPWLTLSGTPTRRPHSWRGWKTRPWIRRLSGMTLPPSTAAHGVESWISSLRATRASHSQAPANAGEQMTPGTSGLISPVSSTRSGRTSVSLRMSQTTLFSDSATSETSYRAWATALQQDCTRRLKQARRMSESGSSSWPTPDLCRRQRNLEKLDPELQKRANTRRQIGLETAATYWTTPDIHDRGRVNRSPSPNATPRPTIALAARQWATPEATAGSNGGPRSLDSSGRPKLAAQAVLWGTPTARDHKDSAGQTLPANGLLGRQVLRMRRAGSATSSDSRVLNPLFVEALMGWPIGWTDCDSAVTELYRWLRRWRSWIFGSSCMDEDQL